MIWLNRMLVLALIPCLCHMPLPWGHSHGGMNDGQLARHLQVYHPATGEQDLPKGWHWHVTLLALSTNGEAGQYPVAILPESDDKSLFVPIPVATTADNTASSVPFHVAASADIAWAHAVRQQQTYLRLNVLLI